MKSQTKLINYEMYYVYEDFAKFPDKPFTINVKDITLDNYFEHLNGIYSLILDGIDEPIVVQKHIGVNFDVIEVKLSTIDYWYSLIMWYSLLRTNIEIQPAHVFFDIKYLTQSTIKNFMDRFFIPCNRKKYDNIELNNIINDCLRHFKLVDTFSFYLMNTINLKDDIDLMNANPEYYDLLHADLSNVPLIDEKKAAQDLTDRGIEIIKKSNLWLPYQHCLTDSFRAKQGINNRQYKEFNYHIGTKPKDNGEVWPEPLNTSFTGGGVGDPLYYMIDSSAGRTAQIMSKMNVADSGTFARLLGLNNLDTFLYPDPNYICDTKNFEVITISNIQMLNLNIGRYYRMNPRGMEYVIDTSSTFLIGKTIYLRSPMTCASNSRGQGICYRCYGDLAYTNRNINIGRMAADILSSKLTQRLLSAKHLLETVIVKIEWCKEFYKLFEIEGNAVKVLDDINTKEWSIIIDPEDISNDLDYSADYDDEPFEANQDMYTEYIRSFEVCHKNGERISICTKDEAHKLYITNELNNAIRTDGKPLDDKIRIPMNAVKDSFLFFVVIHNNELSKTMELLMNILNKKAETTTMDRNQILQKFLNTVIEGELYVSSIHCEVLLANQIRAIDNIICRPEWQYENEPCQVITLNTALINNPSVIISMMYQRLSKVFYSPLTFKKNGASSLDLFFMENPTEYLNKENVVAARNNDDEDEKALIQPILKVANDIDQEFEGI